MIFPLDDSSPSPSPSGITQAAVDNALNVASLVFATLVGAAIGFFVASSHLLLSDSSVMGRMDRPAGDARQYDSL